MTRVEVRRDLYRWAWLRGRVDPDALARKFPKLAEWQAGTTAPTLRQLEAFAAATHAPFGYFFLAETPVEPVPIPDFRTRGNAVVRAPSANLLDTIYVCQQRQEWYRDYRVGVAENALPFVGSVRAGSDPIEVAAAIRQTIGFDLDARQQAGNWEEALGQFFEQVDGVGVLAMRNGVVQNNTHRPLDPDEFGGFAIADPFAPLIFVNAADTKAAQMFTLAHELVHIWAGQSALSNPVPREARGTDLEAWCNQVAAELLVPLALVLDEYRRGVDLGTEMRRLARRFKVSTLVVLRRIFDAGGLSREVYWQAYDAELGRLRELAKAGSGGGDFYNTEHARVGDRFSRAIVVSALEGQTLYRDAFRMLGIPKLETFQEFARRLGIA